MRTGLVLLVLLASCAPSRPVVRTDDPPLVVGRSGGDAGATDRGGVRFGHPPAQVGARWRVSLRAESHAEGASVQLSLYESDFRAEVLAVDGPAPSRLRVNVLRNANTFLGQVTPTAVDGKEYLVDAKEPHVRDASGGAAPTNEAERVLAWFPDLGARTRLDETLPDEAMRIGQQRDELVPSLLRILHHLAWKLDEGHATLARTDGLAAEFDVTLKATSTSGMTMSLAGTARVRLADAVLEELALRGTYAQGGDTGTFEVKRTVSAEPAASSAR